MPDIFEHLRSWEVPIEIGPTLTGVAVTFSNTGRKPGEKKWFVITLDQLEHVLNDIRSNMGDFRDRSADAYDERTLRDLFSEHLTDPVANALSTVQTLPLYTLVAGIVHFSSGSREAYTYRTLNLDEEAFECAIAYLHSYVDDAISNAAVGPTADEEHPDHGPRLAGGENTIFYGAPGTGKSYAVDQIVNVSPNVRTVFHPDTQNSDFIGALKPAVSTTGEVSYKFSPGPFTRALRDAWIDPNNMHFLVIEELNRAPAAAVFGELFQLLDRNADGGSVYTVDFPSEEFASWWQDETGETGKMALPSNLSILATMNSADQGVYPLDTAFRRRWKQEYVPIDYDNAPTADISFVNLAENQTSVPWKQFVEALNSYITEHLGHEISEDRLVGHRFLSDKDLEGGALPGKLLAYLFDDLLRHHGREMLFANEAKNFGALMRLQQEGKQIFSSGFVTTLESTGSAQDDGDNPS